MGGGKQSSASGEGRAKQSSAHLERAERSRGENERERGQRRRLSEIGRFGNERERGATTTGGGGAHGLPGGLGQSICYSFLFLFFLFSSSTTALS
jgi:hypothetical protein